MKNAIARPLRDAVNGLFFCMRREADISTEPFLFFLAYNMQKFFFKSQCGKGNSIFSIQIRKFMTRGLPGHVVSEYPLKRGNAELRECPISLKRKQAKKICNKGFAG